MLPPDDPVRDYNYKYKKYFIKKYNSREGKILYSNHLLESQKSKHKTDREEEVTSTKGESLVSNCDTIKQKGLTNIQSEDDRSNTTNVANGLLPSYQKI